MPNAQCLMLNVSGRESVSVLSRSVQTCQYRPGRSRQARPWYNYIYILYIYIYIYIYIVCVELLFLVSWIFDCYCSVMRCRDVTVDEDGSQFHTIPHIRCQVCTESWKFDMYVIEATYFRLFNLFLFALFRGHPYVTSTMGLGEEAAKNGSKLVEKLL